MLLQEERLQLLSEIDFDLKMERDVIPYLSSICRSGYLSLNSSQTSPSGLYYESYCPENAKGAIVISHGFCESIEKYKEVIFYFVTAGYQVYLADHRGHGRSIRITKHPNMVHIEHFSDYVEDLHSFIGSVVIPCSGTLPLYLYAHSMGGGIGALYLETYPDTFSKAILTSPMLGISMGPVPSFLARALGFIMLKLHKQECYAPGQHAFVPGERWQESGSACRERFEYYQTKKESTPLFQNCGSSYGWAYESLLACRKITQKRNCVKITVPVLVFQSIEDGFVKASAIKRFVKNTPFARLVPVSGSRHEIYNSSLEVLIPYYQEIFRFLKDNGQ